MRCMRTKDVSKIIADLAVEGYEKEVPMILLKQHLSDYVGVDKYKLKATIQSLIELGYFRHGAFGVLVICEPNGHSLPQVQTPAHVDKPKPKKKGGNKK